MFFVAKLHIPYSPIDFVRQYWQNIQHTLNTIYRKKKSISVRMCNSNTSLARNYGYLAFLSYASINPFYVKLLKIAKLLIINPIRRKKRNRFVLEYATVILWWRNCNYLTFLSIASINLSYAKLTKYPNYPFYTRFWETKNRFALECATVVFLWCEITVTLLKDIGKSSIFKIGENDRILIGNCQRCGLHCFVRNLIITDHRIVWFAHCHNFTLWKNCCYLTIPFI